jgi:predicted RNA-binding Zn-ribbon protein involved in translation (DUF1610 family)
MKALLENGILSIQLGLEDYASKDKRRVISAARNLYAGVLLLCKEVLRRLSPANSNDVLIRSRKEAVKEADGSVRIVGAGKKTIERREIEQAFAQLRLNIDLSNLKRLADIRNDIEHLYPGVGPGLIQEAMADAMPIIRAIIVDQLHEEPASLLGADAWGALLNEAAVFKQEQDACRTSFNNVDWESQTLASALKEFRCPHCASTLVRNDNLPATRIDDVMLVCSKCGEGAETEDVFEAALQRDLEADEFEAAKEGLGPLLEECPECFRDTFIVGEGRCVSCRFSLSGYECHICGEQLSVDEYRCGPKNLCSYHHYVLSKDD